MKRRNFFVSIIGAIFGVKYGNKLIPKVNKPTYTFGQNTPTYILDNVTTNSDSILVYYQSVIQLEASCPRNNIEFVNIGNWS